jgi:hypothetical protein
MSASGGSRGIAFDPPGDSEFIQMIVQRDLGYQARAVLEALTNIADLGVSETIKSAVFDTSSGYISLMTPFKYSYNRVMGVAILDTQFDVLVAEDTEMDVQLRDTSGDVLLTQTVSLTTGGNRVVVDFLNTPSSGYVTLDAGNQAYTVDNTEVFPPV